MEIQVASASKARQSFIGVVAELYRKELRLDRSRYSLLITTVPGLLKSSGLRGGCTVVEPGFISIAVDSRLSIELLCTTLAHEMVHAKQYALGQLKVAGTKFTWLGKKYTAGYYDAPWEIEAFSRERLLANKVAKIMCGA